MFKFLRDIFADKEPEIEEVTTPNLNSWFNKKVSEVGYNQFLKEYFSKIKEIKMQLKEKLPLLEKAEISKDNKNVEERVKNIVIGHRDNYHREINRFQENLSPVNKESFSTIDDYQEAHLFNQELNKKIEDIAKRTAKSYQASQHLFFKEVEAVFKQMGELNLLIKDFDRRVDKIDSLSSIKDSITSLNSEIERKGLLEKEIKEKEESLSALKVKLGNKDKELNQLKEGNDYSNYLKLKEEEEQVNQKIKEEENKIFTFFSKLNKAFRKYERVALDDKLIKKYLENYLQAFMDDKELEIKEVLQGLKKSVKDLLDDKQQKNVLELIERSENNYLEELKESWCKLKGEKSSLLEKINENTVVREKEGIEEEIKSCKDKVSNVENSISDLKKKLENIDLNKIKENIKNKIKEELKVEIIITSS